MKKLVLPMVMMASIVTLASCGEKAGVVPAPAQDSSAVTGVVVTPQTPVTLTRKETLTYNSPAGKDLIEFDVTVTDGVIVKAASTTKAENPISKGLQDKFASELSSKVVGKKAKDLKVDAIGGASLTTAAFETFVRSF